ncbi:insulinase family protein [Bacteroidales bacterium OttesenSCG-928-J19]|nr:insulinase family protein [Bacteroidales bacterium OttesenSCG-928-J19]
MNYTSTILPNGLTVVHSPSESPVSYCGFAVKAGTRDEMAHEFGLAHFVEHMLFKGTDKRKSWHIINRMENVGGEINAYTTKEETFLYTVCLAEDYERAMELLGDLINHSTFPDSEIEKEREVVIDEINSYLDTPSELIYDEFENIVFDQTALGHAILGDEESLNTFSSGSCRDFVNRHYQPDNRIFFSVGRTPWKRVIRVAEKYLGDTQVAPSLITSKETLTPASIPGFIRREKDLHQCHVMIGARAYSLYDPNRLALYLLNNILGGPGMNSRLNISLREKNGLVYTVDSSVTSYSDTGILNIYFGCDKDSRDKCIRLVNKELRRFRDVRLTTSQLNAAIKQWKGQLGIGTDHRESRALALGKAFLHHKKYDDLAETYRKIDRITAQQVLAIANELLDESKLFTLIYE